MNKIAFYGSLESDNYKAIASVLKNWLKTEELDIKIRLGGEEIVYENEQLYLYCYNAVSNEGGVQSFLLEGNMSGSLDEAKALLQKLIKSCNNEYITGNFEYVEITEVGDEVSDQFYLK
ncbi:MAG: hypothetical protein SW833_25225 [Cyanobacteriota bacterium]|nr:hypothetical protein [Cyanobacteriota bacterium]